MDEAIACWNRGLAVPVHGLSFGSKGDSPDASLLNDFEIRKIFEKVEKKGKIPLTIETTTSEILNTHAHAHGHDALRCTTNTRREPSGLQPSVKKAWQQLHSLCGYRASSPRRDALTLSRAYCCWPALPLNCGLGSVAPNLTSFLARRWAPRWLGPGLALSFSLYPFPPPATEVRLWSRSFSLSLASRLFFFCASRW